MPTYRWHPGADVLCGLGPRIPVAIYAPPHDMTTWTPEMIRALRQVRGETQAAFAHVLGVTFTTVNRWENAKSLPSPMAERLLTQVSGLIQQGDRPPT